MSEQDATPMVDGAEPTQVRPGEQLRAAREQRGLSPVQAAHEMRIDIATLRALESDDYAKLGAPIFVKGHLRNYAKHLGLPAEALLAAYEQIAAPKPPSLVGYRNEGEQMGGHVELRQMLPYVASGVAAVLLALFALWMYRRPPAPPVETVVAAPTPATIAAPVSATVAAVAPTTVATAPVEAPATLARAEPPAAGVEAPRVVAPGQLRVQLRFSGESWVEVYGADGAPLVYQLFDAGQSRTVDATPPLRVFLGQAAAVTMTIDGKRVDLAALTKRDATARFNVAAGGAVR